MKLADKNEILLICRDHGWEEIAVGIREVRTARIDQTKRPLDNGLEATIQRAWDLEVNAAINAGAKPPFNGKIGRCDGYRVIKNEDGTCSVYLELGMTDYKTYTGVRVNPNPRIWAIGSAGVTVFRDSSGELNYLFGIRKEKDVSNIGGILDTPPGGYLDIFDPSSLPTGLVNGEGEDPLFSNILVKEFTEELGLPREKIIKIEPLSVARIGDYRNNEGNLQRFNAVTVFYAINADTTKEELEETFKKSSKYGGEHSKHFVVPSSRLLEFLRENRAKLTPRAKVNLRHFLLHSKVIVDN